MQKISLQYQETLAFSIQNNIMLLDKHFQLFGVPDAIVSNNALFNSREFCSFADRTGFQLLPNSQENGFAEKRVTVASSFSEKYRFEYCYVITLLH